MVLACTGHGTAFAGTTLEDTRLSTKRVRKRIVLVHATGPLAGLHQILGVLEASEDKFAEACSPSFQYGSKTAPQNAHHERTTPRYIRYREFADVTTGRFNDFAPGQR